MQLWGKHSWILGSLCKYELPANENDFLPTTTLGLGTLEEDETVLFLVVSSSPIRSYLSGQVEPRRQACDVTGRFYCLLQHGWRRFNVYQQHSWHVSIVCMCRVSIINKGIHTVKPQCRGGLCTRCVTRGHHGHSYSIVVESSLWTCESVQHNLVKLLLGLNLESGDLL